MAVGLLTRMRILASARGENPWHSSLLTAMRVVTAGLVVMDGVLGTMAAAPLLDEAPLVGIGLGIAVAAVAAMAGLLVRGVTGFRWHAGVVVLLLAGLTLALVPTWELATGPVWWPTRFLTAALMFVVVAGRTWHRLLLLGLILAFHGYMRTAAWTATGLPWGTDLVRQVAAEFGLAAFTASIMFVIMLALLTAGRVTDHAHAAAVRDARRAAFADSRERTAREVERFVHDEVLHALRTIAMDRRDVSGEAAVAAAARLVRLLSQTPTTPGEGETLLDRMGSAAREFPLEVTVTGDESITLPPDVEYAFTLATLEALRNVVRHAHVGEAQVHVSRTGLTVAVEISDRGTGFDDASLAASRGVRSSIHQRMRDVGGEAEVRSTPGGGTTVRLAWAAAATRVAPQFAGSLGYGALGEVYPRASLITLPYFVYALWNAAWLSPALTAPWAGWTAALVLTAVTAAILLRTLRHGPRPWMAVALPLVAWGTTALAGWALPDGVTSPYLFWAGTAALAVVVPLTVFHHPALIAVTGLGTAALTAAFTVLRAGPGPALGDFLPTITQPAISVAAYLAVRMALDALAWEVYRTGEESARADAEARTRAEFVIALAVRMRQRRDAIASFVHGVATGALDPADAGVRARADALERTVRDQPGVAVGLQEVAARMRDLGHSVTVRMSEDAPPEVQHAGARALDSALAAADHAGPLGVTLTVMRSGSDWRTSLVVTEPERGLRERLAGQFAAWDVQADENLLHLTTTASGMAEDG
ncbi:MAG: hypothetical protein EOL91_04440 [Actinobacteria bacterium]|nr:hypothetical protein [Actinomycetota bacterium]